MKSLYGDVLNQCAHSQISDALELRLCRSFPFRHEWQLRKPTIDFNHLKMFIPKKLSKD